MKVFLDTEFTGLHQNTTLISIGCVDENDNSFYITLEDYNKKQIDDWLQKNVLDNLLYHEEDQPFKVIDETNTKGVRSERYYRYSKEKAREFLEEWLSRYNSVEIWSDCLAYDWVLFCDLFDNNIPSNVSYIPRDICTFFDILGIDPDISRIEYSRTEEVQHNALADAIMIKKCYERLEKEILKIL